MATAFTPTDIQYFATPAELRRWFKRHHGTAEVLWLGYFKRDSGTPSVTWPESVDEALCAGWIDGVRKRIDDQRYVIRFTRRKPTSIWSTVNVNRVAALTAEGRMLPAGLAAFAARSQDKTGVYSFEQASAELDAGHLREFMRNKAAWTFWSAQPPGYRHQMSWRVLSGKREETRARRLQLLIAASAAGERLA